MIQNGFLSISTGRLGNCKHSKLADNDKFSSMPLFALQRCNLTHREMTIAGLLMGANNRGDNELTIQCHFYTFARCGDAAGLMLTVNHRLQSCNWCPQFCTSRYMNIHNTYSEEVPTRYV